MPYRLDKRDGITGLVLQQPNRLENGLQEAHTALARGWKLNDKQRKRIVQIAYRLANDTSARWKDRVQAMRILLMADSLDIRRERNDQDASHQEDSTQVARMRAILDSTDPTIRAALEALRHKLTTENLNSNSPLSTVLINPLSRAISPPTTQQSNNPSNDNTLISTYPDTQPPALPGQPDQDLGA